MQDLEGGMMTCLNVWWALAAAFMAGLLLAQLLWLREEWWPKWLAPLMGALLVINIASAVGWAVAS